MKRIFLPYCNMVKKIFEHTGFNLEKKYFEEEMTKIGEAALATMRYETINGKLIEKPTKQKREG